jgi:hypothetical protein
MPHHVVVVEGGRTIICPHCGSDISDRVLIICPPHLGPDFSGPSVWHCPRCGREWPCEPATKTEESYCIVSAGNYRPNTLI